MPSGTQTPGELPGGGHERLRLDRASVACRRCRRLRTKCVHRDSRAPCDGCRRAGGEAAKSCYFPARGHSHYDRTFRVDRPHKESGHLEQRNIANDEVRPPEPVSSPLTRQAIPSPSPTPAAPDRLSDSVKNAWDILPPRKEVIEGCKVFWTSCFQIGFFPKRLFLEKVSQHMGSVSVFLICGILSVSCRFTPSLIKRYGSSQAASAYFVQQASRFVADAMYEPTLENTQAFFMLALAQWGNGDKTKNNMHMGIAVRMAGLLRLHREETYMLPADATADEVVQSESARRTFWVLQTEHNLHSSHASPVPFSPDDITALLPCDEADFAFGRLPERRAAMAGTKAAEQHPELTSLPSRSLFATLLQTHELWGNLARRAWRADFVAEGLNPWDERSRFWRMCNELAEWERNIPDAHRWSSWNMRGHSAEQVHLAYLSVVMVTRLNNIILRRIFLEDILAAVANTSQHQSEGSNADEAPSGFWAVVADELFENARLLREPIFAFVANRAEHEGFSANMLFSLHVCGTLAVQLIKTPALCPRLAHEAKPTLARALEILSDLQGTWPLAYRWLHSLKRFAASIEKPTRDSTRTELATTAEVQLSTEATANNFLGGAAGISLPDVEGASAVDLPPQGHLPSFAAGQGRLDMLTAAAISAECQSNGLHDGRGNASEETILVAPSVMGSVDATAATVSGSRVPNDDDEYTFEVELGRYWGQSNFGLMDVWIPPDVDDEDGFWSF